MNKIKRASAALLMLTTLFAAPTVKAGKADDTLNVAFSVGLESLDLYFSTAREAIILSRLIYDTLVDRDPVTSAYRPLLASNYRVVNDTTLEFVLREDIVFHNGDRFDADDVVYTLNWAAKPSSGVLHQQNVSWIDRVEKLGPYKVRLISKKPFPAALEFLSGPLPIYSRRYLESAGHKAMAAKPVGTGPYKVTEVAPGSRVVMERNERYFRNGPKGYPAVRRVVQRTLPEANTQMVELLNGTIDWAWKLPPDQAQKLGARSQVKVVDSGSMRIGYLQFDASGRTGKTALTDVRVRKAIAHAIDRQGIATNLVKGGSEVVHAMCFKSQLGCTDAVTRYEYNPSKAKALLAEAGFAEGLELDFHSYGDRRVIEAITRNLNSVGIRTNVSITSFEPLRDKVSEGKIALNYMNWGSNSINDVSAILPHFFTLGSSDYARDEQLAKLVTQAGETMNAETRKQLYAQALKLISDAVYVLPTFTYTVNYAMSSALDFTPTADEIPRFYTARWK